MLHLPVQALLDERIQSICSSLGAAYSKKRTIRQSLWIVGGCALASGRGKQGQIEGAT